MLEDDDYAEIIKQGGVISEQDKEANKAKRLAAAIRGLNTASGMNMTGNHRVQVAANPLNHIAHVIGAYKEGKQLEKQGAAEDAKAAAMTAQNMRVMAALMRRQQAAGPAPLAMAKPEDEIPYP